MKKTLTAMATLVIGFSGVQADFPSFPICTHQGYQWLPDVSGNIVVWQDFRNGFSANPDVYGKDLSTGEEFAICTDESMQSNVAISGSTVVWQDESTLYKTVRGKNISTGAAITFGTHYGGELLTPAADGNLVVFEDKWRDGSGDLHRDVFAKDVTQGVAFQVCGNDTMQSTPDVSGDIIVWYDQWSDSSGVYYPRIYAKDLASGDVFPICMNNTVQANPVVSGNTVVWMDTRNGNYDIYGYDISTGTEFPICTDPGYQFAPAISGNLVVWEDSRNTSKDIYGYDLLTGREFAICTDEGRQALPAISGELVVWEDERSGTADIYGAYVPEPSMACLLLLGGLTLLRRQHQPWLIVS